MVYKPEEGKLSTFLMSKSITNSGARVIDKLTSFKIGGTRKKKRFRYSNGIKTKLHRKKHKTNRNKSNVSRLFVTYKRLKEKCYQ
jgi:hypothetical protein